MQRYPEQKWRKLGIQMLRVSGATRADAETITDVLITGSLRGVDSHGVRVLPYFTQKRRRGRMKILRHTHAAALLDAGNRWGPVSAKKSMEIAIEMARKNGIGSCSVVNGDWITNLSYFSMMAVDGDMIGMIFAREGPVCAPWGGTKPVTGTNPMSIAIPTGGSYPIVLDFATTISAQSHVKTLLLEGKPIPEGWLIDRKGNSVKGYDLALKGLDEFWKNGSLLPFGTYKGYGINLAIDILCGALNLTGTGSRAKGQGVLSLAIRISAFAPIKDFEEEVARLIDEIKSSPLRPGFDEILLPGERGHRITEERKKEGIPIDETSWQEIVRTCGELGIDANKVMK
ncbi:MAG: Ldh family oxidoreductase [Candidatus Bathyarchaeia archaeon]